jgi:hypothetical protein
MCLFGEITTLNCGDHGFSGCTTFDADGQTVARCVE